MRGAAERSWGRATALVVLAWMASCAGTRPSSQASPPSPSGGASELVASYARRGVAGAVERADGRGSPEPPPGDLERSPHDPAEELRREIAGLLDVPEDLVAFFEAARIDDPDAAMLEGLGLDDYLRLVWARDPRIEARRRERAAAAAQLEGADRLDELAREYRSQTRELRLRLGAMKHDEPVEARFPWPNVGALRGEWLQADVERAREELRGEVLASTATALQAAAEWQFLARHLEVIRGQRELYERLAPVVESQVAGGEGSLADLLAVQAEQESLREKVEELVDRLARARAQLDRHLNLPETRTLPTPPLAIAAAPDFDAEPERWQALADEHQPGLARARSLARRARLARRLAEVGSIPPASRGAALPRGGATAEAGASKLDEAFGRERPLPAWWGMRDAALQEMREREQAAASRLRDTERWTRDEVEHALVELRDARRDERLYREELRRRSDDALAAVSAAYEGGRARFPDVLAAARRQWDVRLGLAKAERAGLIAEAALMRTTGVSPRHLDTLERRP